MSRFGNVLASCLRRVPRFALRCLSHVARALVLLWTALAVYYSNLPWPGLRTLLAVAVLGFGIWAMWATRRKGARWAFAGLFAGVLLWFVSIQPSHDRPWRTEVAVMPRAIIDGDRVRFTGYRNFRYRSRDDFDAILEEREVSIAHLTSVDLYISYWQIGPVAHTFLSFNFDNAPPVCISIETRPEVGEGFAPIASMFKQFELIYVVGDERDLVAVRTSHRGEEVFLYPIRTSADAARRLFREYLARINELADRAEFYHLLSNNCTLNIVRYANSAGRTGRFDIRHLLNGYFDRYLFRAGLVDTSMPFDELRRRSHINAAANAAGDAEDFSQRIRAGVPSADDAPRHPSAGAAGAREARLP